MNDAIDTVILHEELAYADVLPLLYAPVPKGPLAEPIVAAWADRNLRMLQAAAALEDQGQFEKVDDDAPSAAHIQRIDAKVNLLLELVGHLIAASQSRPPAVAVRFNSLGIVWQPDPSQSRPATGSRGRVEVYLRECLVQPLTFVGTVDDASGTGPVQMRFDALTEIVSTQLEKLVFRRHRRHIAGTRVARRGSA